MFCNRAEWKGREAYVLGNNVVRLTTLTGGGHIAEFRLENQPDVNPLWIPPWKTIEPYKYEEKKHKREYGSIVEGKLLSGVYSRKIPGKNRTK